MSEPISKELTLGGERVGEGGGAMNDKTFTLGVILLVYLCSLTFCGEPDLHDYALEYAKRRVGAL